MNGHKGEDTTMEAMKVYQQWLADFADDPQTVADLKAIENDPA